MLALKRLQDWFKVDLAIPLGQFVVGIMALLVVLYIFVFTFNENRRRMKRLETSIDSVNTLVNYISTQKLLIDSINKSKHTIDYDTIIVPKNLIQHIKKFKPSVEK